MQSLIKWEFIKTFKRLKGVVLFLVCVITLSSILPVEFGTLEKNSFNPVTLFLSLSVGVCFVMLAFYPMYNIVCDYRKKSYALECSSGYPLWKIIVAKSVVNIVVAGLAAGALAIAVLVFQRFNTENIGYLVVTPNERIHSGMLLSTYLVEAVLVNPACVLFGYIISSTTRVFRNARITGTVLFMILHSYAISMLWGSGVPYLFIELVLSIILFAVAARRADRLYEQYISNM